MAGPTSLLLSLALTAAVIPQMLARPELFSWPPNASSIFAKITSLPRQDVVAQMRALVEPVTKEALAQLTPEVVRQLAEIPKEDVVKYLVDVVEPATKSVVSGVSAIIEEPGVLVSHISNLLNISRSNSEGLSPDIRHPAQSLGAAAAKAASAAASPALDELIRLGVEGARVVWRTKFEPLHIDHLDLHFDEHLLTGELKLDQVQVSNASTFVLQEIKSEIHNMAVNFVATVDYLNVTGLYDMDGILYREHKIFGAGNLTVWIQGLRVAGRVVVGVKDLFIHVDDLTLDISIQSIKVEIEHLLGEKALSDLASGVISDVGPDFLQEFRVEVGAMISGQVKEFLNDVLGAFSIPSILERIKGLGQETAALRQQKQDKAHSSETL